MAFDQTQVFRRCDRCGSIVGDDGVCPSCGAFQSDAERTQILPRIDPTIDRTQAIPSVPPPPVTNVNIAPPPRQPVRRGVSLLVVIGTLLVLLSALGLGFLLVVAAQSLSWPDVAARARQAPLPGGALSIQPTATPPQLVVANTGGEGVYIRRTPRLADRLVAWPEGTRLEDLGEETTGEGMTWRKVRDPQGNVGYVPTQWLEPPS